MAPGRHPARRRWDTAWVGNCRGLLVAGQYPYRFRYLCFRVCIISISFGDGGGLELAQVNGAWQVQRRCRLEHGKESQPLLNHFYREWDAATLAKTHLEQPIAFCEAIEFPFKPHSIAEGDKIASSFRYSPSGVMAPTLESAWAIEPIIGWN
jgi:hypothetical protein